ncbi:E3 ubiquitin-protein ligase MARCHF8-like isoform X2 [Dreissena polymorpha]|uniref:RING-CH-type domain-containing protein n=1 Tax=Dreissena polymorpha TaxID=45954 RepID=A0A9D3YFG2_DREPO|nr:E3 ubiquitin-protein ligase MARCHF8-like isoform X2 [Dreissena polymorpha]KAH3697604.1 hypothetical protein DPMN_085108 [Dreissena polymorpha]
MVKSKEGEVESLHGDGNCKRHQCLDRSSLNPDNVAQTSSTMEIERTNMDIERTNMNIERNSSFSDCDGEVENPLIPNNSPFRLLSQGQVIVPHFSKNDSQGGNIGRLGQSLGSMNSARCGNQHSDLVWIGSSQNTMHLANRVPVHGPFRGNIVSSNSNMSRQLSSCGYSSMTMSETGTDMCAICRICQMPDSDRDPLISPCRCAGSLKYVHTMCLKKWVRTLQHRLRKQTPCCELCHYQFMRHKHFKFSQWRWPRVRTHDKFLHLVFLLSLLVMIGCAIATIMCFISDRDNTAKFMKNKMKLTSDEVITLACGVTFFVAFFIAMTVEIKARHTIYKLFTKFLIQNTEWTVEQYDPDKDPLFKKHKLTVSQI